MKTLTFRPKVDQPPSTPDPSPYALDRLYGFIRAKRFAHQQDFQNNYGKPRLEIRHQRRRERVS
jgi:hypothetical protein